MKPRITFDHSVQMCQRCAWVRPLDGSCNAIPPLRVHRRRPTFRALAEFLWIAVFWAAVLGTFVVTLAAAVVGGVYLIWH